VKTHHEQGTILLARIGERVVRTIYSVIVICGLLSANAAADRRLDSSQLFEQGRTEYLNGQFAAAAVSLNSALRGIDRSDYTVRARVLAMLGDVYTSEDELSKAEQVYRESLALYEKLDDKKETAHLLRDIAAVYSLQRRDDEALRLLQKALKLTRAIHATGLEAEVLNIMGVVYYRQHHNSRAEGFFKQALDVASKPQVSADVGEFLNNLGNVYQAEHKYGEAESSLKQALKYIEAELGASHPELIFTLSSLGSLYTATARYADAEQQYQRALAILEPVGSDFDTRIARLLHALGVMYVKAGRKEEADAALARATEIARRNFGQHSDMISIIDDYATVLKNQGKSKQAEELRTESKRARAAADLVTSVPPTF
jgi:tetratricopeptide (TPR) repeat protein